MLTCPEILAPAGDKKAFLAAVLAGADSIYCGLRDLNARMEAANFTIKELASLSRLAKEKGIKLYITLNSIVKQDELSQLKYVLSSLKRNVEFDGVIIQDLSVIKVFSDVGLDKEVHLSTLSNFSLASSFEILKSVNIKRVVLPRELTIDEIKYLNERSRGIELEIFVHGALCYSVSGRCYWSSMLGGKSALRGRCVQPCRRIYRSNNKEGRFFSCLDLSVDVLTKLLLPLESVKCWKIEGRKKGPHYVFYTVKAYKLLRDNPYDRKAKKMALDLLKNCLGRETSHYYFLSHRRFVPINTSKHTGSGLYIGAASLEKGNPYIRPRIPLLPKDVIRIGYQDKKVHFVYKINQFVSRGKKFFINRREKEIPPKPPVFLIDRREDELRKMLLEVSNKLEKLDKGIETKLKINPYTFKSRRSKGKSSFLHIHLEPKAVRHLNNKRSGIWIELDTDNKLLKGFNWYWLSPVMWPEDEQRWESKIKNMLEGGARNFVINSVWHIGIFKKLWDVEKLNLWAGPYCNLTNTFCLDYLKWMGFKGAVISFELSKRDILTLPKYSPIDLGIFMSGFFPFSISRTLSHELSHGDYLVSKKGEPFWIEKREPNYYLFAGWKYDITQKQKELQKAGYKMFVFFHQIPPKGVSIIKRKFEFNWNLDNIL